MNQNIIIKANKFHADSGFQVDPDYSPKAIKIAGSGVVALAVHIPKSICNVIRLKDPGGYEIHIERWFCEKPENKEIFKSKL